jgi:methylenetetrahydrofolate dehydrogenase (NADP+)/methenyltetrahydrofolate cyclohydrolase
MSEAQRIDGKVFAERLRADIATEVSKLKSEHNLTPGLAVILVGEDPASQVYVRNKNKQTKEAGMNSYEHKLSAETSQEELLALIDQLNNDPAVHGILCQLPVPKHIDQNAILGAISPAKDVDGFHIENAGALATGGKGMVPCTPLGCLMLLNDVMGSVRGKTAVVVGRSNIVGRPMAQLLLQADATVTIAHRHTADLDAVLADADIVVVAVGMPGLVKGSQLKKGCVVIDVGINRVPAPEKGEGKTKLVGDVDYDSAVTVAGAATPVPGGVGPMTIACLLNNTLIAVCRQHGLEAPNLGFRD